MRVRLGWSGVKSGSQDEKHTNQAPDQKGEGRAGLDCGTAIIEVPKHAPEHVSAWWNGLVDRREKIFGS